MTIKSILALPHDGDTEGSTLACAAIIARQFGAHVAATYIEGLPEQLVVSGLDGYAGYLSADLVAELEARAARQEAAMRVAFEDFVRRENIPVRTGREVAREASASWTAVKGHAPDIVALRGGAYDLIVAGRPDGAAANSSRAAVEAALFATGRPLLVAPPSRPKTIGETVLIGWNRSAPAARAFHAAKALLLGRARKVRLLSVATGAKSGPSAEQIADNLARHGIQAEVRELAPDYRSVGEVVLAEASAIGADLVVMGAYSQNRIRRLVLGGVTQHVLAHAALPVFMAH
jgi:nucleotide-binding universal stress UspA family protein